MKNSLLALAALSLVSSCAHSQPAATTPQKPELPSVVTWKFNLDKPAKETSAGVYDQSGKLVRVLWTMKPMQAGEHQAGWDGKDAQGKDAPVGKYSYKVAASNATYKNIGFIGNTGENTFQSVPNNFECVAVDAQGNAYTAHDWYEPHHDVKMWDAKTGRVIAHSGHPVGGLVRTVVVDDQYAYTTAYEGGGDRTTAKFYINRLKIDKTPGAQNWPIVPFTKAGPAIMVYNGHAEYPAGTSDADKDLFMFMPLRSLALKGNTLLATDGLAGKVRMFDKESGEETGSFNVKLPLGVAVGDDGRIWVGHEHSKVSVFDGEGKLLATPVDDLKQGYAIALHGNVLYAADMGAGQVGIYDIAGNTAKFRRTFGEPARPGDRAAHRFYTLHGLAVDKAGNILTVQNEFFFNGGRLAKFDPTGKPLWEQLGLDFVSNGAYSQTNPDWFVTLQHHGYELDRKTGIAKSSGNTYNNEGYKSQIGPINAARLGKNEFVWMANGDGMIVYRVVPPPDKFRGPSLKLAAILASSDPKPDGTSSPDGWKPENYYKWSWNDEQGDGKIQDGEAVLFNKPEDKIGRWQHSAMAADSKGNLWFASYDWAGADQIWCIPLLGLNKLGNPIYEWKNARRVTKSEQLQGTTWKPQPKLVRANGNSFYIYGGSRDDKLPQNGGLHMGGNVLMRFEMKKDAKPFAPMEPLTTNQYAMPDTPSMADLQWQVALPEVAVGLDVIPPGKTPQQSGVMVGGNPGRGGIHHYTKDGLLIGQFQSDEARFGGQTDAWKNWPSGLMDFYGALNVVRDPRDGMLDVFVEDDFNNRILWYRVDDRDVKTLSGEIEKT